MNIYEIKTNNSSKFISASTRKAAINKFCGLREKTAISMGVIDSVKKVA